MVTATSPSRMVPPLLKPITSTPCLSCQCVVRSKMPAIGTPSSFAISTTPSIWSWCPWLIRIAVAPSIARGRWAASNSGCASHGSTSSTWSAISILKPEWPSQVIRMP